MKSKLERLESAFFPDFERDAERSRVFKRVLEASNDELARQSLSAFVVVDNGEEVIVVSASLRHENTSESKEDKAFGLSIQMKRKGVVGVIYRCGSCMLMLQLIVGDQVTFMACSHEDPVRLRQHCYSVRAFLTKELANEAADIRRQNNS